jgi:hypothetical protein
MVAHFERRGIASCGAGQEARAQGVTGERRRIDSEARGIRFHDIGNRLIREPRRLPAPALGDRPEQWAQRRDGLDVELRQAETMLARLPAIATDDPQATMAADLIGWASAGLVSVTAQDIHRVRVTGLTIMPAFAGLLLMMAGSLPVRRRAVV